MLRLKCPDNGNSFVSCDVEIALGPAFFRIKLLDAQQKLALFQLSSNTANKVIAGPSIPESIASQMSSSIPPLAGSLLSSIIHLHDSDSTVHA